MERSLFDSFRDAWSGLVFAVKDQRNLRIHLFVAVIALISGVILRLTLVEFALVLICIGLVITAEIFNTVVEAIVDLCTQEYHPLAALAKDVSAAGVLVMAILASLVGFLIYLPKFWEILSR